MMYDWSYFLSLCTGFFGASFSDSLMCGGFLGVEGADAADGVGDGRLWIGAEGIGWLVEGWEEADGWRKKNRRDWFLFCRLLRARS